LAQVRRSLTITPENERRVQGLRSTTLGLETPVDLDYTTATNMLVEIGFKCLERTGTTPFPLDNPTPLVRLPVAEVVEVLFSYIFYFMKTDAVPDQDREQWAREIIEKEGGVRLLMSLRNLSAFQPKKPLPEALTKHPATVSHVTVKG
jgi:hypothetical protein